MNDKKKLTIITLSLMTIIEIISLYFLYHQTKTEEFLNARISFRAIFYLEIIVFSCLAIITYFTYITKNKNVYSLNNKLYLVFIIIMFFLISFCYLGYGNFINSIIFLIFNNILKSKNK